LDFKGEVDRMGSAIGEEVSAIAEDLVIVADSTEAADLVVGADFPETEMESRETVPARTELQEGEGMADLIEAILKVVLGVDVGDFPGQKEVVMEDSEGVFEADFGVVIEDVAVVIEDAVVSEVVGVLATEVLQGLQFKQTPRGLV
jgi:hypothetical protein